MNQFIQTKNGREQNKKHLSLALWIYEVPGYLEQL